MQTLTMHLSFQTTAIRGHLHISHNALYLPPKILHNLCFSFLLGITAVPREIENIMPMQNFGGKYGALREVCKLRFGPSSLKSLFQSEAKCKAIDLKMIFYSPENKINFHYNKGFAFGPCLKVRDFETRKWPFNNTYLCRHTNTCIYIFSLKDLEYPPTKLF